MSSRLYPKRLIEVDLPIARISENARRDKTGSISTLHIWWARRPLAACRAVLCAALWPDPVDDLCPDDFRKAATTLLVEFADRVFPARLTSECRLLRDDKHSSAEGLALWEEWAHATRRKDVAPEPQELRAALLNFIAEFSIRENSTVEAFLETGRSLTCAAHESLSKSPGTRPLVADPFAGGGAIPLEALRVGADSFASDLNPIPVLLNRVLLEWIPKLGKTLPELIKKWGGWITEQLRNELSDFYPPTTNGQQPVNYIWARVIRCEGPSCGVEVPLMRSLWLSSKPARQIALRLQPNPTERRIDLQVAIKGASGWFDQSNPTAVIPKPTFEGTVQGGSVTCPCCGYTTPVTRVRAQLLKRAGGSRDARLMCVVTSDPSRSGKDYHLPRESDLSAVSRAAECLRQLENERTFGYAAVPDEPTPNDGTGGKGGGYRTRKYGVTTYGDFFNSRQLVQHLTITSTVRRLRAACADELSGEVAEALQTIIALTANRQIDRDSAFCRWNAQSQSSAYTFGRQAIPMLWDFVESPSLFAAGGWETCLVNTCKTIDELAAALDGCGLGQSVSASATQHPLPDQSCSCLVTDPPYYDSVPYAELSDFFFVWLKRSLGDSSLVGQFPQLTRRDIECVVNLNEGKDKAYFQQTMTSSLAEGRRICRHDGLGVVVFAHKSTAGWESQLQSMIDAGWILTASWPLDTEMAHRLRALNSAALTSSIHLVCRPRENADGKMTESVGEWRDVLGELPQRIHEWMPRLAAEGVVGADAIFACLGPALEIFSRYSRVEKANGELATLREYLEFVWAAVSTEALALIFRDADASGLEPDARLTAMWLWTIGGGVDNSASKDESDNSEETAEDDADEEESDGAKTKSKLTGGFTLEFDAARKIAQGLGVHLEQCTSLVEVKSDKARLLPVAERTAYLFGKGAEAATAGRGRKKTIKQRSLFEELGEAEAAESGWTDIKGPPPGTTVLDRVHQSMILFAANRGELLKRFLVEDGVGKDARFWKLADNLNKLYPSGTEERRWVEGVLARKKGLGL